MLIAFPLQQRLHKRAPVLRYTYIACLVQTSVSFRYHPPLSSSETHTFLSIPQDQYVLWPLTNS